MDVCSVHQIIQTHKNEVIKLLTQPRPSVTANFKSTPVFETPQGEQLTLDYLENIYTRHYPDWNKKFQCFPEGPMFYDKLFTSQPWNRAKDIENKKDVLKAQIGPISYPAAEGEPKIAEIVKGVLRSLQPVITTLKLTDKVNNLQKLLTGKLKGKTKEMKNKNQSEVMSILQEVQDEMFDKILENDKLFKLYEMR